MDKNFLNVKNLNKNNKILIVGGTGFIGCHLAKLCVRKKFNVFSISKSPPKKKRKIKKVKYLYCDISKKNILRKKLKKLSKIDFLVNLGGDVDHKNFRKTYLSHYKGSKNLSEVFLNKKLKKFVQIGSSMEYGHNKSPQSEKKKCNPLSNYGKAKYLATKNLINLFLKYKFPAIILRPYQIYGPRQDFNRLIPFVITNCKKNKNFSCSSGRQYRDFLFVKDFVEAIFKCLKSNKEFNGQIFNIGYGEPYNLKKLINLIRNQIKLGNPVYGKIRLRKEENLVTYPNIKKAKKLLNWLPKTKLKNGIIKTIKSY
tara:strand:- start:375 stop:1310 length:936 start_codon:yes stop_codon:yes gene_type:complete